MTSIFYHRFLSCGSVLWWEKNELALEVGWPWGHLSRVCSNAQCPLYQVLNLSGHLGSSGSSVSSIIAVKTLVLESTVMAKLPRLRTMLIFSVIWQFHNWYAQGLSGTELRWNSCTVQFCGKMRNKELNLVFKSRLVELAQLCVSYAWVSKHTTLLWQVSRHATPIHRLVSTTS